MRRGEKKVRRMTLIWKWVEKGKIEGGVKRRRKEGKERAGVDAKK